MGGCRKIVCEACSTRLDGVNTCLDCLSAKLAPGARIGRPWRAALNRVFGAVALLCLFGFTMASLNHVGARLGTTRGSSRDRLTTARLEALSLALVDFRMDMGRYPRRSEGGLEALDWQPSVHGPVPPRYGGPYLPLSSAGVEGHSALLDGYYQPIRYAVNSERGGVVVFSYGANGRSDAPSYKSTVWPEGPGRHGDDLYWFRGD